jgi:hypothetical protein
MTIVTVAVALIPDAVPTAVGVAVIEMILLPADTVDGAVKIAVAPLAVLAGEITPQGATLQPKDHVTPEFVLSLVTTAMTGAVAFVSIVAGGN